MRLILAAFRRFNTRAMAESARVTLVRQGYEAFNGREIDAVLALPGR
jgi:hypothetical protein